MATKIAYILADNRSGSTLLDQLLGAHQDIVSLGEVHHLPAYATQNRALYDPVHPLDCSCGVKIEACPFWSGVAAEFGRPFADLTLKVGERMTGPVARKILGVSRRHPRLYPLLKVLIGSPRVGRESFLLFDAIFRHTGARCLVDSTKSPFRFRALYDHAPERVRGIVLVRDYRATVHSKMKRGMGMVQGAVDWTRRMQQIRVLTRGLPVVRVRYEDLCSNPEPEMRRICAFLDVEYSDAMLTRPAEAHHLGGSPSRFDPSRKSIKLDQSYLGSFSDSDLATMRRIAGSTAMEWGYT